MSIICENQISLLKYVNALDISQINKNKRFITSIENKNVKAQGKIAAITQTQIIEN